MIVSQLCTRESTINQIDTRDKMQGANLPPVNVHLCSVSTTESGLKIPKHIIKRNKPGWRKQNNNRNKNNNNTVRK